jgi:Mn-containing catalase
MFIHNKELQFTARVTQPDAQFANLLLEQFGGPNGELKAAMQYFVQAFAVRQAFPKHYDMLMDIATEEFSHLEIVGATIQLLLNGINGELKNAAEDMELNNVIGSKAKKENYIHNAIMNPQFFNLSGGGPILSDSNGNPWQGSYVNANGDLTVDLRSNIAAESRAKIVYEYLMQLTPDPLVKETLGFLMTREVAHFQMFEAALYEIKPNFPPGILQGDPRFSNKYFNMSRDHSERGPWNKGKSTGLKEEWEFIDNPEERVRETDGLLKEDIIGTNRTIKMAQSLGEQLSAERSDEIKKAIAEDKNSWAIHK